MLYKRTKQTSTVAKPFPPKIDLSHVVPSFIERSSRYVVTTLLVTLQEPKEAIERPQALHGRVLVAPKAKGKASVIIIVARSGPKGYSPTKK